MMAVIALGNLKWIIIVSQLSFETSNPSIACITSKKGMLTDPKEIFPKKRKKQLNSSAINNFIWDLLGFNY